MIAYSCELVCTNKSRENRFLHLYFNYETHLWNLFMKLIYETHLWNSFMKLIYETHLWNSFMKLWNSPKNMSVTIMLNFFDDWRVNDRQTCSCYLGNILEQSAWWTCETANTIKDY